MELTGASALRSLIFSILVNLNVIIVTVILLLMCIFISLWLRKAETGDVYGDDIACSGCPWKIPARSGARKTQTPEDVRSDDVLFLRE